LEIRIGVMRWYTALLNGKWNTELWRGLDVGFSSCAVSTYYYESKYFEWSMESEIQKLIQIRV